MNFLLLLSFAVLDMLLTAQMILFLEIKSLFFSIETVCVWIPSSFFGNLKSLLKV